MPKISVVVAVYNAQQWLPRFFASLQSQTLKDFEVLLIDDCSTDSSAALISELSAVDSRFKLLWQPENIGAGSARNRGIMEATGETLCFADPDDLLPENSLEVRYTAYKKHNSIVRACHDEILNDGTILNRESRPERLPEIFRPADEVGRIRVGHFLCAHWTWLFPTNLLRRCKIFNGENMRTAEDIVLLARLFFHVNRIVWIPDTVYYWVKRSDSLSTTVYSAEHYINYFQCCDIFYEQAEKFGQIQPADIFFNEYLSFYPAHLLAGLCEGKNTDDDVQKVISELVRINDRYQVLPRCIGEIQNNPTRNAGLFRLWMILHSKKTAAVSRLVEAQNRFNDLMQNADYENIRKNGWKQEVSFDKFDYEAKLLRCRYLFCDKHPEEIFMRDGTTLSLAYAKNRIVFKGQGFKIFERIIWLPVAAEGKIYSLSIDGWDSELNHTAEQIRTIFAPKPVNEKGFPPEILAVRRLARSQTIQNNFLDAWMFIDKDCEADDNAEHLYRWVMRNHPEINIWFVISKNSHDWQRLEEEGFRLVDHGSVEHKALFLLSSKLISSQMDRYIFEPLEDKYYHDFLRPQFINLPHGVTKDDVSGWFNSIPFDLFIAATKPEAKSISENGTPYIMGDKEVRLGGFPRYDKWLEPFETENMIFIMPTWRADLVGKWEGKGQKRELNPEFYSSRFVQMWKYFFNDPRLKKLIDQHGYRVIFFAHPCFEDYLDGMPFPDFVEKKSKKSGSIIDIMRRCKIMITDFSSVAFDMAYMRRPVIYYQYESKAEFTRSQKWVNGYIDYKTMGFGPVCRNMDDLIPALEEAIIVDGKMPELYAERAEEIFAYHDANCCKRSYDFIVEASKPFL
ncbi:bifunctional glycosyltransferase/CDP-glycerol:glycerophosphate glycerophosphotransferase [Maridesulfovibrio hydrothermalis]|uniref:Putative glycosyltransferase n=1 Tax=Maridesulfovibrio hydrothermalis AM13 = DSM 14728 TaxID=1121451 RepID=L0R8P1_9BACT|nr:CDP-glycerol glycerophosphotransferase family protein [Maridesulfovibrio hydrothermalis]CCO22592.1 putative glycosyltransferase [Maridesulfovibrio hydrothermalis AM13 = DSM 14728]